MYLCIGYGYVLRFSKDIAVMLCRKPIANPVYKGGRNLVCVRRMWLSMPKRLKAMSCWIYLHLCPRVCMCVWRPRPRPIVCTWHRMPRVSWWCGFMWLWLPKMGVPIKRFYRFWPSIGGLCHRVLSSNAAIQRAIKSLRFASNRYVFSCISAPTQRFQCLGVSMLLLSKISAGHLWSGVSLKGKSVVISYPGVALSCSMPWRDVSLSCSMPWRGRVWRYPPLFNIMRMDFQRHIHPFLIHYMAPCI